MALISPQVDIAMIAIGLSIVSQIIQRKVVNRGEMKRKQAEMKGKQNRIKELMKRNDTKSKNELQVLEREMMEAMSTMMKGSMKMMVYSMILFIPTLWFLSSSYGNEVIPLPISIPWFGTESLIQLYNETNWIGWYVLTSLICSLSFNAIINIYEKIKGKGVQNA